VAKGTPEQGYQSRFSPAQLYRAAIVAIDQYVGANLGAATFSALATRDQDKLLKGLESATSSSTAVSTAILLAHVLQNTKEGIFPIPFTAATKDMAAWKMIGFPGAHYDYKEWFLVTASACLTRRSVSKAGPGGRVK